MREHSAVDSLMAMKGLDAKVGDAVLCKEEE